MQMRKMLVTLLLMTSFSAFGHGEDMAGPHGGEIRMPGAFHTELVLEGKKKFQVYLLDHAFKSPKTEGAMVSANFVGEKSLEAKCQVKKEAFDCEFSEEVLDTKGKLQIKAKRAEGQEGVATYRLPIMKY